MMSLCIVTFFNKEGVELFQYGKNRIRFRTYDALYIKEDNGVAVSSGLDGKQFITLIDIENIVN
jgi:hypothetical protein